MRVSGCKNRGTVYDAEEVLGVWLLVCSDATVDPSQRAMHGLQCARDARCDVFAAHCGVFRLRRGGARWLWQKATHCRINGFTTAYLFNSFTCRLAADHIIQSHNHVRANLVLHLNAADI